MQLLKTKIAKLSKIKVLYSSTYEMCVILITKVPKHVCVYIYIKCKQTLKRTEHKYISF